MYVLCTNDDGNLYTVGYKIMPYLPCFVVH